MPVTLDQHIMRVQCEGKRNGSSRCVGSLEVTRSTRDECNVAIFDAGWRLSGKYLLCRACLNDPRA